MRFLLLCLLCCLLLSPATVFAKKVYDVDLPEQETLSGEVLHLNGYGLRTKFFIKVYLGSLYTASPVKSTAQVLAQPGAKLIRMDFIHSKVGREKIVEAFAEGFEKNSPQLKNDPALKSFLDLFTADFISGDRVDLLVAGDGSVSAVHNGRELGTVVSPVLGEAVLLIYLGDEPADEDLKEGMLGS
ncbi:MAG: hypothetical protein C0622_14545 [Desulfuromonas sp.]|nr:MAG: hypothetical protein C0622_14545 [Desulfuromonas sp.]